MIKKQRDADGKNSAIRTTELLRLDGLSAIRTVRQSRHSEPPGSEVNALDQVVQDR